jgi:phage terminase small subunit
MPRERSPNRDKAFELYKKSNGAMLLKDIAEQLGVKDTQIRKWKNQDKWDDQMNSNVTNPKRNVTKKKKVHSVPNKNIDEESLPSDELTEKQRLFCMYYMKYYNATKSYQKAYECDYFTANANGSRMLVNASIKKEIERLKSERDQGLILDARAVLQKYIDIAFSDITDYLSFGRKQIEVDKDKDGNPVLAEVNYVHFKNYDEVDGTLISEVKQGKDGVSIKLEDKMKALEKLSLYFDLFPDNFKRRIEEEKLKINKKRNGDDEEEEYEDDGFLEALEGKTEEVWDEET